MGSVDRDPEAVVAVAWTVVAVVTVSGRLFLALPSSPTWCVLDRFILWRLPLPFCVGAGGLMMVGVVKDGPDAAPFSLVGVTLTFDIVVEGAVVAD